MAEEYTDEDMANVGRALMEALPEGYHYSECPSEIVADLQNQICDLERCVIRKAKIVSMCWTTAGQRIDSDETLSAINDLHNTLCAFYGVDPKIGFKMTTNE